MTTMTPPSPPQPSSAAETPRQSPSQASRVVAILAMVLGGLIILGAVGWALASAAFAGNVRSSSLTAAVSGVGSLDVDMSAGNLRIEFTDVDQAELDVRSAFGADRWTLTRDGDELRVASPRVFGLGWLFDGESDAVLRLPADLAGLDADLDLSAGDLRAGGDFGALDVNVSAGHLEIEGAATDVTVELSAGRAELELDGVRTGDLSVSAGELIGSLTGPQPRELALDVSAGSLSLSVPDGDYDVRSEVSAGDFDNRVGSVPGASSTVTVSVSAGNATLRAD